jgi:hypothetical protein
VADGVEAGALAADEGVVEVGDDELFAADDGFDEPAAVGVGDATATVGEQPASSSSRCGTSSGMSSMLINPDTAST